MIYSFTSYSFTSYSFAGYLKRCLIVVFICMQSVSAVAAIDAYSFPDEEMRQRYNSLIDELRCPQCLNTNLAGSDSMISKDLRREVHRLVLAGKSDDEVRDFMQQRYGDFILYKPQVKASTYVLWFGPVVLFFIATAVLVKLISRRRNAPNKNVLTEVEQNRLDQLLSK
ncbi:MAG: cytochrome c-type biogenesis protein CcmH [Candidatus Azotimanducaceae bacterium]|jgi:cytochrome c-type biogenesis protein CcmH